MNAVRSRSRGWNSPHLAGPWAGGDGGSRRRRDKVSASARAKTRALGADLVRPPRRQADADISRHNRGKRSIEIDFESADDRRIVRKLAARSDVLIENFKVGGLKKFGLDYASLSKENPRLIYCSITGFGQDGPYAPRAGYDLMVQGMGGMMASPARRAAADAPGIRSRHLAAVRRD